MILFSIYKNFFIEDFSLDETLINSVDDYFYDKTTTNKKVYEIS